MVCRCGVVGGVGLRSPPRPGGSELPSPAAGYTRLSVSALRLDSRARARPAAGSRPRRRWATGRRIAAAGLLLSGLVAGPLPAAPPAAPPVAPLATPPAAPPTVWIDAPADLAPAAARLREWQPDRLAGFQRLIGLPAAGAPIRVVLVTEDSIPASVVPPWIAGYAQRDGLVVLFPARVPAYPNSSLDELLGHEVAHVLIQRAAGGRPLPRWFNEGLAMLAEEAWDWGDRSRAVVALARGGDLPLAALDRWFAGSRWQSSAAYALSAAFVRDVVRRHGRAVPAAILARLAAGEPFEPAFAAAAGVTVAQAESDFRGRLAFWSRWLPFLTTPTALWIAVTLLALLAIWRRRERDRERAELWAEEERRTDAADGPPDGGLPNGGPRAPGEPAGGSLQRTREQVE